MGYNNGNLSEQNVPSRKRKHCETAIYLNDRLNHEERLQLKRLNLKRNEGP